MRTCELLVGEIRGFGDMENVWALYRFWVFLADGQNDHQLPKYGGGERLLAWIDIRY